MPPSRPVGPATKPGCRAWEPSHLGSGSLWAALSPAEELLLPTESPFCSKAHCVEQCQGSHKSLRGILRLPGG